MFHVLFRRAQLLRSRCNLILGIGVLAFILGPACSAPPANQTPVAQHGLLTVKGNRIVDRHDKPTSLAGVSLFWGNKGWQGEDFYHADSIRYLKNEWHASIVRAAMGVEAKGGLLEDWDGRMAKVRTVVDAAIAEGLYVIVDWHSHHAENHPLEAQRFFKEIARAYGQHANIIYEIYNEPLEHTDWSKTVKPYAMDVIKEIRAIDPDNLIVVGTQKWAQEVDKAADDPITGFANIAYSLHFYAGTHKQDLRDKAQYALDKGIALMVTEWGTVNADGDGAVAKEETLRWMEFIKHNQLSHCNWALNAKAEGAAIFKPGTSGLGPWSDADLTESGQFVKNIIQNW